MEAEETEEATRARLTKEIRELEKEKLQAVENEDFDQAFQVKQKIDAVQQRLAHVGESEEERVARTKHQIAQLQKLKLAAVEAEDFDEADECKQKIDALKAEL